MGKLRGKWVEVQGVPVAAWSAALLPTGKVLLFQSGSAMTLFDPKPRRFSSKFSSGTNLFCAGLALLADGRLLAVGGHEGKDPQGAFLGVESAELFDSWEQRWIRIPDMAGGERWYPSAITLPDGKVLVASGTHAGQNNETLELLDPERMEWRVVGKRRLPLYPWVTVMPQGEVLFYGPQRLAELFDPILGAFERVGLRQLDRSGGTGVMLSTKKAQVLVVGGGKPATGSAELLDPQDRLWRPTGAMAFARHHPNAVLLPDGRVLVIGGYSEEGAESEEEAKMSNVGVPMAAEVFDPEQERWEEMEKTRYGHGYHSTALLLPDGSVMAAGPGPNLEIYTPWYFSEQRPVFSSVDARVTYGQSFKVQTPDAHRTNKVVAIRLSSVTHSLNTDQRYVELEFVRSGDGLLVGAPSRPSVAPPGYYLLFIVTEQRIPSEGKIIHIG